MLAKLRFIITVMQLLISMSLVIVLMYIFKNKNRTIRQVWAKYQMKLLGIKVEIEGTLDESADMIVMNHQSLLDIIMFEYLHPRNLAWVAKKEIANLFWFGHILKAPKMIIVERESKSSLVQLLKDSKEKLKEQRALAIFPEGTRTDGKKLRKFKAGAKMIALKNELRVQPIVIVGTRTILDTHNFTQNSGTVKIIYLPTVKAEKSTTWYEDMEVNMAEILDKEIKDLDIEP